MLFKNMKKMKKMKNLSTTKNKNPINKNSYKNNILFGFYYKIFYCEYCQHIHTIQLFIE